MSYRLVILGILAEQPHYGYDLKQTIERQHFADYIRLSGGGLYYHLRKLRDEGYIEEQTVEREGNYPDRHIYRITERGRGYLLDLLRSTLDDVAGRRVYDPIDAALAFAFLLPREEVLARLQHQLDAAYGMLAAMEVTQRAHRRVIERTANRPGSAAKSESLYAQLMIDHNLALLRHEVRWLLEAIDYIEQRADLEAQAVRGEEHADRAIAGAYDAFESQLAAASEEHARYNRELEQVWREYERRIAAHPARSDADLVEARRAYQQRTEEIRRAYEAAMRSASADLDSGSA